MNVFLGILRGCENLLMIIKAMKNFGRIMKDTNFPYFFVVRGGGHEMHKG